MLSSDVIASDGIMQIKAKRIARMAQVIEVAESLIKFPNHHEGKDELFLEQICDHQDPTSQSITYIPIERRGNSTNEVAQPSPSFPTNTDESRP